MWAFETLFFLATDASNAFMFVYVSVNSINSGRIRVSIAKPHSNPRPVQTYPSIQSARQVLLEFAFDEKEIEETLNLLSEVGPNQPLHFLVRDIPQKILWNHGFKL
jgi:hypothetical protein